jgi:hypothetical protein
MGYLKLAFNQKAKAGMEVYVEEAMQPARFISLQSQ